MPQVTRIDDYLYVSKVPNYSITNLLLYKEDDYTWHLGKASSERELCIELLKKWISSVQWINKEDSTQLHLYLDPQYKVDETPLDLKPKKEYVISLQFIDQVINRFGIYYPEEQFSLINFFLDELSNLLAKGATLGINFREVFYIREGEKLPAHFRQGMDVYVKNIEEYKEYKNRVSYQLGKAIFNQFRPQPHPHPNSLNQIIQDHLCDPYLDKIDILDDAIPLQNYHYIDSAMSGCFYFQKKLQSRQKIVIPFTYPVAIQDLKPLFNALYYYKLNADFIELILVFKGTQYAHKDERQKAYEALLLLIKQCNCTALVHLFLITRDDVNTNLLDLCPEIKEPADGFYPLLQESGYYLSSTKVVAAIYRNIQKKGMYPEYFLERLTSAQKQKCQVKQSRSYIYVQETTQETEKNERKSKTLSNKQLKSKALLSTEHQESVEQTQMVNEQLEQTQTQNLNQDLQHSKNAQLSSSEQYFWPGYPGSLDLEEYCKMQQSIAKAFLPMLSEKEDFLVQSGYLTQFYLKNHSKRHFYMQLAYNQDFSLQSAAKLFGYALSNSLTKIKLPGYSVDRVLPPLIQLSKYLFEIQDGFHPSEQTVTSVPILGRILCQLKREQLNQRLSSYDVGIHNQGVYSYLSERNILFSAAITTIQAIEALEQKKQRFLYENPSNTLLHEFMGLNNSILLKTKRVQSPLNYLVFLDEESLSLLEPEQRESLICSANSLINLLKPHSPLSTEDIYRLEAQLVGLVKYLLPKQPNDITYLEKLMSLFEEHNEDNLKILTQILLLQHAGGFASCLKLLNFLDERSLLDYFYKIYFKYATTISSVVSLIQNPVSSSVFLTLAAKTPVGSSPQEGAALELVSYQLLLFAAQNNITFNINHLSQFEKIWSRLGAQFIAYCGNEAEAEALLNQLAQNLTQKEGLAVAPCSCIETFFIGFENLFEQALSKNVLQEQIQEISGVSFLPMDASYATQYNNFKVVCPEMNIRSSAINPKTGGYLVTHDELLEAMIHHHPGDSTLKTTLFRYLGTQTLREPIMFYRTLYQQLTENQENPIAVYIYELLCAYYTAMFTGNGYADTLKPQKFQSDVFKFLSKNSLVQKIPDMIRVSCIQHFFLQLSQIPKDEQNGIHCLWSIWKAHETPALSTGTPPISDILVRKFPAKQLGLFLLRQKETLEKALPALRNTPEVAWTLMNHWCHDSNITEEHQKWIQRYLTQFYPEFEMKVLLHNIANIARIIEFMSVLASHLSTEKISYMALNIFINNNMSLENKSVSFLIEYLAKQTLRYLTFFSEPLAQTTHETNKITDIESFLFILELLATEIEKQKEHSETDQQIVCFLIGLKETPKLYSALSSKNPIITILCNFFLATQIKEEENYQFLFQLSETLLTLESKEAQSILTQLIEMIEYREGFDFLKSHAHLNVDQLQGLIELIQKVPSPTLALNLLQQHLKNNLDDDFTQFNQFLNQQSAEEIDVLLKIALLMCKTEDQDLLSTLQELKEKPLQALKEVINLHELHPNKTPALLNLLDQPHIENAITQFKEALYQENLQRYDYQPQLVKEKIAQIKLKNHANEQDLPLSLKEQQQLWLDYQQIMAYMLSKPVQVMMGEAPQMLTINELDEPHFRALFQNIQHQINMGEHVHDNQLLLIALSAEALYRTTYKFPRYTQILTLLKTIYYPGNLIHEVKTGEGKNIIAFMHATLLCALNQTVNIVTENNELAKNALKKFERAYRYLGIPYAKGIIYPDSAHEAYMANGINISTASNLALFQMSMALQKKELPQNASVIADEIDATLTTTVQYRLAAAINPMANDTQSWTKLYQLILDFVKKQELFIENHCSWNDDVSNLRNYFIIQRSPKNFLDFTQKISDDLLNILIESALVAHGLEENIDYYVVETLKQDKKYSYAAPIIASTNRPDPQVSYSDHVQQLLHTLLNNKKPTPKYPFLIEPSCETLVVMSAKNFFDDHRLKGGRVIGLTGTSGTWIERQEFYGLQGLIAYSYPSFHQDRSEHLGLITAFDSEEHHQKILEWIQNHKINNPKQPILIVTESPQTTEQLYDFFAKKAPWPLQIYHGHEDSRKTEEHVIHEAGQDNTITIANQSLARGADFSPQNEDGLLVINFCSAITPSALRQIYGRAARDGHKGNTVSIINAASFGTASDSLEQLALAFEDYQRQISLNQQKERKKKQLLEESRYIVVNRYLLQLRKNIDKLIAPQFGEAYSIVPYEEWIHSLSSLNKQAETHYTELLETHEIIDETLTDVFLSARVADYQRLLNQWIPQEKFNNIEFVEPSIPLDSFKTLAPRLQGITVDQLSAFAHIFNMGWKISGHQQVKYYTALAEELIALFDPYFKNQCSGKQALGEFLVQKEWINPEKIEVLLSSIQYNIEEIMQYALSLPLVGSLIPAEKIKTFFLDYLNTTKTQISEQKWDELNLPIFDLSGMTKKAEDENASTETQSGVNGWFNSVKSTLSVNSLPLPFIVKRLLIPTILGSIKKGLKIQFANTEPQIEEICNGLDTLANELPEAMNAFLMLFTNQDATTKQDLKVGFLLDKFGSLVKSEAFILVLTKYLELNKLKQYIPYVQAIPAILATLEHKYSDYKIEELLNLETLITLLHHASSSELILNILKDSPYKAGLEQVALLNSEFFAQMSQFSVPEFLNLIKVIAHPKFFTLMTQLPPNTDCEEMYQWLEKIPETASETTQQAINELLDYQTNHQRIALEKKQHLFELCKAHVLNVPKVKQEMAKLTPKIVKPLKFNDPEPVPILEAKTSNTTYFRIPLALAIMSALIVCNIIYFSVPLLVTTLLVTTGMAAYSIAPYLSAWFTPKAPQAENPLPQVHDSKVQKDSTKCVKESLSHDRTQAPQSYQPNNQITFFAKPKGGLAENLENMEYEIPNTVRKLLT